MSYMPRIYKSAVEDKYYKMHKNARPEASRRYDAAGIITPTDTEDIEALTVLDEVLGLMRVSYNLRNMCRVIRSDQLTFRVDTASKLSAHEKVEPLEEADITGMGWSTTSFDLWKNVAHIAMADESIKKSAHDILALGIQDAAKALMKSENDQIATVVEAATNTSAGSDWGTVTDGRSANSPYADILTAFNTIEGTGGFDPDLIAAHPYVWMDFFGNDYVKGQLRGEVLPGGNMFSIPGLPGVQGLKDYGLTNTQCLVLDSDQAVFFGEGPTEAARYRKPTAMYEAYLIAQWLEMQIVQENAIYELTAVHA